MKKALNARAEELQEALDVRRANLFKALFGPLSPDLLLIRRGEGREERWMIPCATMGKRGEAPRVQPVLVRNYCAGPARERTV